MKHAAKKLKIYKLFKNSFQKYKKFALRQTDFFLLSKQVLFSLAYIARRHVHTIRKDATKMNVHTMTHRLKQSKIRSVEGIDRAVVRSKIKGEKINKIEVVPWPCFWQKNKVIASVSDDQYALL